jgi:hypothetical protein
VASAALAERKPPRVASPAPRPVASPAPAGPAAAPATGPAAGVPGSANRAAGTPGPAGTAAAVGTAGPRVTLGAAPPGAEVLLKGKSTFEPPPAVVDYLKTHPRGGGQVAVRFPGLAAGVIHVQEHRDKYSTPGELQAIDIQHPALEPLRSVGVSPLLVVEISNNAITGYVTVSTGARPKAGRGEIVAQIRRSAATLGLLGMGDLRMPTVENKLEGGALSLKTDLAFTLGGFLQGTGSLGLSDDVVTFTAHASASVGKIANPALDLTRRRDGVIEGRAEIPVNLKNFSGNFVIGFAGGVVDASGTFRYTTEKLSGEVTLVITDAQTARNVAYQHLPPEAIDASARTAAGGAAVAAAPASTGPKPGPRAVAGWGTLDVHYNEWLSGKALVVVDSQGYVTVVGKITPPAKVEFPQTKLDYERKIFALEVRATYGIPVVGNVFLFAGVGLFALAKISPLTLSKIEIVGTYSTDPTIFNSFSLSANLNISALAGIRLRAEGGVGIEIADHDIKIGAALNATAGIRAYVDATPLIGYRELADPAVGRRGEFYVHGEAEIAAQPFLALDGELFVKLVTPWWSPASDHTWTWPLGELMYPLPGEIGVGADVDYIFGSGKLPTISPKKVDFNADRFMSDLMDDNVPHGSAAEVNKPGRWNERLQAPPAPPAPPQIKDTKGPAKRKDDKTVKDAGKTWAAGMKAVGQLKQRGETQPYAAPELEAALKNIKSQHGFSVLQAKPVGDQWEIAATLGKDSLKKPLRIKRTPGGAPAPATPAPGAARPIAGAAARDPRREARAALAARLRDDHTIEQARGIVAAIASELKPIGIRRLEVGPADRDGSYAILAEASPLLPLAALVRSVRAPRGRSVRVAAEITLAEPSDVRAGPLPPASESATVPRGGAVLPALSSRPNVVRAVTWNTSDIHTVNNSSHAEHQLIEFIRHTLGQDGMQRIQRIVVNNFKLSPCSTCAEELAGLLRQIGETQPRPFRADTGEAQLHWTELYLGIPGTAGINRTTWQSVNELTAAGWRLYAPKTALPDESAGKYEGERNVHLIW